MCWSKYERFLEEEEEKRRDDELAVLTPRPSSGPHSC